MNVSVPLIYWGLRLWNVDKLIERQVMCNESEINLACTMMSHNISSVKKTSIIIDDETFVINEETIIIDDETFSITWWKWRDFKIYVVLITLVVPAIFIIVSAIAMAGNSLVICLTIRPRQKKMRTSLCLFLMNLAISDLLFVVIGLPAFVYCYAMETWQVGNITCRITGYLLHVTVYVSAYTIAVVAVKRCLVITGPTKIRKSSIRSLTDASFERNTTLRCIMAVWLAGISLNLPVLFLYEVKSLSETYSFCGVSHGKKLFVAFFLCSYVLPLTIAMICNAILICHLKRKRESSVSSNGPQSRNLKVMRLLITVVIAFTLCWLPVHFQLIVDFTSNRQNILVYEIFHLVSFCVAYSRTAVNPIIYYFMSPEFRLAITNISYRLIGRCDQKLIDCNRAVRIFRNN